MKSKNNAFLQQFSLHETRYGSRYIYFPPPFIYSGIETKDGRVRRSLFLGKGLPTVVDRELTAQEGTALLVGESDVAAVVLAVKAISRLKDPNERQDGEGESGPVNETTMIRG